MQTKDIKADGVTEYAYAKQYQWDSRYGRRADRVVVTAVKVPRKVWGDYGLRTTQDGVAITYLDAKGRLDAGRTDVVRSAEIRELWETFDTEAKAASERRTKEAREKRERANVLRARLAAIFEKAPEAKAPWFADVEQHADGSITEKGTIYNSELATLLEAVYAAGVEAGKAGAWWHATPDTAGSP